MGKSKRKTHSLSPSTSDGQDRLSNLPEAVICKILSLLETKEACRTCILGRSWRSLWTMIPDVSFHYPLRQRPPDIRRFASFVNKVLDSRKPPAGQAIRKFRLRGSSSQPYYLAPWIRGAVECQAQELELELKVTFPGRRVDPVPVHPVEPLSIFSSETMVALRLYGDLPFTPSPDTWLPSLKILDMKEAVYDLDALVPTLLSGCPVLQELSVCGYYKVLHICAPKLNKLCVSVKHHSPGRTRIEIDAASLKYLSFRGFRPTEYVIKNLDKVMEAELSMVVCWRNMGCLFDLFQGLSNVKSLYLSIWVLDGEFEEDSTRKLSNLHHCLPEFPNLVSLCFVEISNWDLLPNLLQKSAKLKVLVIERRCFAGALWTKSEEVPSCLSSCLTHFTYKGFSAEKQEFENVEYLCRNSSVLKTLTIQFALSLTKKPQEDRVLIYEELARLSKGSKYCEFRF